jgi:ParB family transcriptional regulator, chromosome partitioning protein
MTEMKPRLGKGLSALLGDDSFSNDANSANRIDLAIQQIERNPYQPRKSFDDEEIDSLSKSIREHGVLQPLVVRHTGDSYQLIAGERRLRAAQVAGLENVPVTIVDFNDQQVLEAALVENIQRADLNAIEKAHGFKDYLERYQVPQEQLAQRLGLDRTTISNLINLLNLPEEVQNAVRLNQISNGHAKILKGLNDPQLQTQLCRDVIMKGLSVKALETAVRELKNPASTIKATPTSKGSEESSEVRIEKTAHVLGIETEFRSKLSTKFEIKLKAKDKGQIIINFESNDDFERIVETLRR